jgi:periplasmic protein TonB
VTGVPKSHELAALPRSTAVSAAAGMPDLASADLTNVVPFVRPRAGRAAPEIAPPDAMRTPQSGAHERAALLAFAMLSLALHAGALWALSSEPAPFVSIGEQVISLEIVVGATAPAGVAQTPGEAEVATAQPQEVPVAAEEKLPEQTEETVADATKAQAETLPEPKHAAKSVEHAKPAREPRRIDAPTKPHAQRQAKAAPATAANNVGVGRSDADTNYAGLVSAHLRRHQQYPADARSRGEHGTATVTFALDGSGRVTSARLAKGSGVASLDQEVQAMVRRASPFPPPPSRHAVSFTVPVTFRLN